MNIFITNENPITAARDLCDIHVKSKMIIESAIMLQHCFSQDDLKNAPRTKSGNIRKRGGGYYHHPCSVWVRESTSNFDWLGTHALEMCYERNRRWSLSPRHYTQDFIEWALDNISNALVPHGDLTAFPVAITGNALCRMLTYGRQEDGQVITFNMLPVTQKYQQYIIHDKKNIASWSEPRTAPFWWELNNMLVNSESFAVAL